MIIKCKICGKPFEARQHNHTLCSDECRRLNHRNYSREYAREHTETIRISSLRYRKMRRAVIKCQICGEIVNNEYGRSNRMHDECIFNSSVEIYRKERTVPHLWRNRLYSRGYCAADLKEAIADGIQV